MRKADLESGYAILESNHTFVDRFLICFREQGCQDDALLVDRLKAIGYQGKTPSNCH